MTNNNDMGEIPLDQGKKSMDYRQRTYWEDSLQAWKSMVDRVEIMLETGIGDKRIVTPAEVLTGEIKNSLRDMKLKVTKDEDFTPHGMGRKLKELEEFVETIRERTLPILIMEISLKEHYSPTLEVNLEQVLKQTSEILIELRELQTLIREELNYKFGKYQNFGSGRDLGDFEED